jgi:hypothetical protein
MKTDPHARVGPLRAAFIVLLGTAAILGSMLMIASQAGCASPPSARVVQVQSLKAVGHAAEAAVSLAANLYAAKQITAPQAKQVMEFYDQRFQPAFRLAVAGVNANLDSIASADLVALATQLSALVASFSKPPQ